MDDELSLGEAFEIIDKVIELGPEHVEVPNIAVLGNQSVGKSSLLSLLLNVNLYCEDGLATSGPTQIHSRTAEAYAAHIQIEYHQVPDGRPPRIDFGAVDDPGLLVDALQRAGNEARRIGSRNCDVRTLAESRDKNADPEDIDNGTPEHTSNVVILHVFGPEQPDLSIIDLPGLVTKTNGKEITEAAAKKYIKRQNTLVLLCLAAGGQDPSEGTEVQIVAQADPDGERTIGIVTKADQILSRKNSHFNLIRGEYDCFQFTPKAGWWPFRGRTRREKHLSIEAFAAVQDKVFEEDYYCALERDFSWPALKRTIVDRFANLVRTTVPQLQALAAQHLVDANDRLQELPPEVADAPGVLFSLIEKVQEQVREHYLENLFGSGELKKAVDALACDLATGVAFVPLFRKDWDALWNEVKQDPADEDTVGSEEDPDFISGYKSALGDTCGTSRPPRSRPPRHGFTVTCRRWDPEFRSNVRRDPSGGKSTTHLETLFLDRFHPLLMTCCNITVSSPDVFKAMWHVLVEVVRNWMAPCMQFEERVWTEVDRKIEDLVAYVCDKNNIPVAEARMLAVMRDGIAKHRENGKRFIRELVECEMEDPKYVGPVVLPDLDTRRVYALCRDLFAETYGDGDENQNGGPTDTSIPERFLRDRRNSRLIEGRHCQHTGDDEAHDHCMERLQNKFPLHHGRGIPAHEETPPAEWPELYVQAINYLGVYLVQYLEGRSDSLVDIVGRRVKGEVVHYIENLSAILRTGLGLKLDPAALAIAKSLTEADPATVRRRVDAKRRLENAEKLNDIFKRPRLME